MNKKEKLAFAVVAALAMTSGGFAFGQSVNTVSSDQVIYACVTGVNGNITKVSNTPKTCPKGTTPISWNRVGGKGDQGIQGLQGVQGDSGPQGIPGTSGISLNLLASDGQSYQIFYLPSGYFINLDGAFWNFDPDSKTISGKTRSEKIVFYKDSTCTSDPYLVTMGANSPISNTVLEFPSVGGNLAGKFFTPSYKSDLQLGDFNSFQGFGTNRCRMFDFNSYSASFQEFGNFIRANASEINYDFGNSVFGQHAAFGWDFGMCSFESIAAPNNSFRRVLKSYKLQNCHLNGGQTQETESVLELYSTGGIGLRGEKFYWVKISYDSSGQHQSHWVNSDYSGAALDSILSIASQFEQVSPKPNLKFFALRPASDDSKFQDDSEAILELK